MIDRKQLLVPGACFKVETATDLSAVGAGGCTIVHLDQTGQPMSFYELEGLYVSVYIFMCIHT
jgi:hypothetical protein